MDNQEYSDKKIHQFNFEFSDKDFIIIYDNIELLVEKTYDYTNLTSIEKYITIPKHSILRVDNITMGGRYKRASVEVVFSFLTKKNKHVKPEEKIPNKINLTVYELNGVKYSTLTEEEADKKSEFLIRKNKINNLLEA